MILNNNYDKEHLILSYILLHIYHSYDHIFIYGCIYRSNKMTLFTVFYCLKNIGFLHDISSRETFKFHKN